MTQADIINQLLLLTPIAHDYHNNIHNAFILFLGGACAFLFAFLLTFAVRAFCYKMGWLDYPAERRVHSKAVPRLGGVAIFVAFVLASLLLYTPGSHNERAFCAIPS